MGKKAKLVLLEADPLTDIANTRRVAAVVLRRTADLGRGTAEESLTAFFITVLAVGRPRARRLSSSPAARPLTARDAFIAQSNIA